MGNRLVQERIVPGCVRERRAKLGLMRGDRRFEQQMSMIKEAEEDLAVFVRVEVLILDAEQLLGLHRPRQLGKKSAARRAEILEQVYRIAELGCKNLSQFLPRGAPAAVAGM